MVIRLQAPRWYRRRAVRRQALAARVAAMELLDLYRPEIIDGVWTSAVLSEFLAQSRPTEGTFARRAPIVINRYIRMAVSAALKEKADPSAPSLTLSHLIEVRETYLHHQRALRVSRGWLPTLKAVCVSRNDEWLSLAALRASFDLVKSDASLNQAEVKALRLRLALIHRAIGRSELMRAKDFIEKVDESLKRLHNALWHRRYFTCEYTALAATIILLKGKLHKAEQSVARLRAKYPTVDFDALLSKIRPPISNLESAFMQLEKYIKIRDWKSAEELMSLVHVTCQSVHEACAWIYGLDIKEASKRSAS